MWSLTDNDEQKGRNDPQPHNNTSKTPEYITEGGEEKEKWESIHKHITWPKERENDSPHQTNVCK